LTLFFIRQEVETINAIDPDYKTQLSEGKYAEIDY